ncbi:hypothetical protein ACIRD3_06635 [Kitasatospora sp. NPDC093550]|uniref:hypothetical protein n=1 Tax=Kitasatospora sp. NPDC093550 TaxID=3364089 RepID=UPI0037F1CBCC
MENASPAAGRTRKAAFLLTGLALSVVLVLGAVAFGRAWAGEPFPTADPSATAKHLNDRTLTVFDALGLPSTAVLDEKYSTGIKADVYACHRRGLAHFLDGVDASAPPEPRTAKIHAGFTVMGLTDAQGQTALEQARRTLTERGWAAATDAAFGRSLLHLTPPPPRPGALPAVVSGSVAVSVEYGDGYLSIRADTVCAHYPGDTPVDWEGKPQGLPDLALPAQLRRG